MDQEKRTGASQRCMEIEKEFQIPGVGELFFDIEQEFPGELYSLKKLYGKFSGFCKPKMEEEEKLAMLGKVILTYQSGGSQVGKYCRLDSGVSVSPSVEKGRRKKKDW